MMCSIVFFFLPTSCKRYYSSVHKGVTRSVFDSVFSISGSPVKFWLVGLSASSPLPFPVTMETPSWLSCQPASLLRINLFFYYSLTSQTPISLSTSMRPPPKQTSPPRIQLLMEMKLLLLLSKRIKQQPRLIPKAKKTFHPAAAVWSCNQRMTNRIILYQLKNPTSLQQKRLKSNLIKSNSSCNKHLCLMPPCLNASADKIWMALLVQPPNELHFEWCDNQKLYRHIMVYYYYHWTLSFLSNKKPQKSSLSSQKCAYTCTIALYNFFSFTSLTPKPLYLTPYSKYPCSLNTLCKLPLYIPFPPSVRITFIPPKIPLHITQKLYKNVFF